MHLRTAITLPAKSEDELYEQLTSTEFVSRIIEEALKPNLGESYTQAYTNGSGIFAVYPVEHLRSWNGHAIRVSLVDLRTEGEKTAAKFEKVIIAMANIYKEVIPPHFFNDEVVQVVVSISLDQPVNISRSWKTSILYSTAYVAGEIERPTPPV